LTKFFVRICVGTWNVGGKLPHDDLDIDDWIDTDDPADIYVFGYVFPAPLPMLNLVYLKVICYLRPEKGNMFSATQSTLILSKT